MICHIRKNIKLLALILTLVFLPLSAFCDVEKSGDSAQANKGKPQSKAAEIIGRFKYGPLNWRVPKVGREVERVELSNGMIVYMMEDHSVPGVDVNMVVKTGKVYQNRENFGVADLTASLLRKGGTKNLTPEKLNDELDYMAADLTSYSGDELSHISLFVISSQLDRGMEILADVVQNPAFDGKKLEIEKSQLKENIRRKNDNPSGIAGREFKKIVFGEHPKGWEMEWKAIKKIDSADLQKWYEAWYRPNNTYMAISGDFNKKAMVEKLNSLFGKWPRKEVDHTVVKKLTAEARPGIFYAKKDVTQSNVVVGHLGVRRGNPDEFSIRLMNYILGGGGFTSVLTERVRSNEGLVYTIYSHYDLDDTDLGIFYTYFATKSESTMKALDILFGTVKEVQEKGVTEKQLKVAKDSYINSFIFKFADPEDQVMKLMLLEVNGMPGDYYDNYIANIKKVTCADIKRVAREHLRFDSATIVLVGKPEDLDKPLDSMGLKVKEIILEELKED